MAVFVDSERKVIVSRTSHDLIESCVHIQGVSASKFIKITNGAPFSVGDLYQYSVVNVTENKSLDDIRIKTFGYILLIYNGLVLSSDTSSEFVGRCCRFPLHITSTGLFQKKIHEVTIFLSCHCRVPFLPFGEPRQVLRSIVLTLSGEYLLNAFCLWVSATAATRIALISSLSNGPAR
jgi:hypothetical protein